MNVHGAKRVEAFYVSQNSHFYDCNNYVSNDNVTTPLKAPLVVTNLQRKTPSNLQFSSALGSCPLSVFSFAGRKALAVCSGALGAKKKKKKKTLLVGFD